MPLSFNGSSNLTLGVEIELQILEPDTLDLSRKAQEILLECKKKGIQSVKAELHQSMLEIETPICESVKQCRENLSHTIQEVRQICQGKNHFLSLSGTHPFQQWTERLIYPSKRYLYLEEKFQWLVRRMNVYGMHLHIGMPDAETALRISNALIPYLPWLLALSTSSPYWRGIDTGLHSCRIGIIESFPYAGIPPFFNNWIEFEQYYETLTQAGAIQSMKDLYWFIRPNTTFGTLEIRIFDVMSTLSETMALVAFTQCLIKHLLDNPTIQKGPQLHWIAPSNILIAARDGLDGVIFTGKSEVKNTIRNEIYSFLNCLLPIAQDLDCLEELSFIKMILQKGTSSERQRLIFELSGDLRQVVSTIKTEFETDYMISNYEIPYIR